jgi:hypothetical protein
MRVAAVLKPPLHQINTVSERVEFVEGVGH